MGGLDGEGMVVGGVNFLLVPTLCVVLGETRHDRLTWPNQTKPTIQTPTKRTLEGWVIVRLGESVLVSCCCCLLSFFLSIHLN